jgi:PAS domain S-box-containing protein
VRPAQALAAVLVTAYLVWTLPGVRPRPGFVGPLDGVLQATAYVVVAGLALAGAWRATVAWRLVAGAVALRALGFVLALASIGAGHPLSYPSVADAAWVCSGLALVAAVALRLHELAPRLPRLVVLDGLAGGLLVLGLAVAVLAGPVGTLSEPGVPSDAVAVNLGYPVLDTALLVGATTLAAAGGSRLRRADVLLMTGIVGLAAVDVVYLVLLADGSWRPGTLLASLSLVATSVIASAAWAAPALGPARRARRSPGDLLTTRAPSVAFPATVVGASLIGLVLLDAVGVTPVALLGLAGAGSVAITRGLLTVRSDRVEADRALGAASEDVRRFQALVEASSDFIGMADVEGNILYVNPAGRSMLALPDGHDVTTTTVARIAGEDEDRFALRWSRVVERGHWEGEAALVPVDGGPHVPVAVSSFVLDDPATGSPYAIATIQRDIQARLSAEAALRDLADQRARLLHRLVQAQEDERARIAADVHDDPVQVLAAVDLRLGLLRKRLAAEAPGLVGSVDDVQETLGHATERLRHLLFDLELPQGCGLGESLAEAADFVFAGSGVRWRVSGDDDVDLPEAEQVTAYRVAKEAMVNARKHAGATRVEVHVSRDRDEVVVTVRDDGRGISPDDDRERPGHLGLSKMRDRAEVAGGRLDVRRLEAGGTEMRLWLPLAADRQPVLDPRVESPPGGGGN